MAVFKTYNALLNSETKETKLLTSIILQHTEVQCIFLLGSSRQYRKTATIFAYDTPTASFTGQYYVLVLIEKDAEYTRNMVQDKLENTLQHVIPTTVMVLGTASFFQMLTKGYSFALQVVSKAERLFQSENILFPTASAVNKREHNEECKQAFTQAKRITDGFLASAELHKCRGEYHLAAFMLHQAAEQALRFMVILCTGFRPNTHSLDKLFRYGSMFCSALPDLFPKQSEKEKRLFALLNRAYLEPRYTTEYTISSHDLQLLNGKVAHLLHLFDEQCSQVLEEQQLNTQRTPSEPKN